MANSDNPANPITSPCKHTQGPYGYVARMEWLERMSKRYQQVKCNRCGLWAIWRRNG